MPRSGQTTAQKIKQERQESLRELLSKQKHLEHVLEIAEELRTLSTEMEPNEVNRLKIVIDTKLKLINKYLPDLKAVEMDLNHDLSDGFKDFLENLDGKSSGLPDGDSEGFS